MKKIAIMGAGGQGRTVAECVRCQHWGDYVFLDDAGAPPNVKWVGSSSLLSDPEFLSQYDIIIAIGDNAVRAKLCGEVLTNRGRLATVRHVMSYVSGDARIGPGCSIHCGAHVGPNVSVGTGCIVNNLVTIAHDCLIGDFVNLCDGAVLGGHVCIAAGAFVGLNATILPGIRIGAGATIGAGAVVTADVAPGATMVGNPGRAVR